MPLTLADLKQTRASCAALDAPGRLLPNQAVVTLRSGTSLRLEGFKVIERWGIVELSAAAEKA